MNDTAQRRIFIDATDTRKLVLELADGPGVFVPTRLHFSLGDEFALAIRAHRLSRAISVPVTVVGRRAPKGAVGLLSTGVLVKLAQRDDPTAQLLLDLASGSVVDFEAKLRERMRIKVDVRFDDFDALAAELTQLLDGEPALFTGVDDVVPGDRLLAQLVTRDGARYGTLPVEVRGVVLHAPMRGCRVRFFDDEGPTVAGGILAQGPLARDLTRTRSRG